MLLVGYCFGIRLERRLCEEVHINLAYRWFCRLGLDGAEASMQERRVVYFSVVTTSITTVAMLVKIAAASLSASAAGEEIGDAVGAREQPVYVERHGIDQGGRADSVVDADHDDDRAEPFGKPDALQIAEQIEL